MSYLTKLYFIFCLILVGSAGLAHAFPFWLNAPARNNPNDPKSPFYHPETPTIASSPSNTVSPSPSQTYTVLSSTPSITSSVTPTPTLSATPSQSSTCTLTPTFTQTCTFTLTSSDTLTSTLTLTFTVTETISPSPTYTLVLSPTPTPTITPTATISPTWTISPTFSVSPTPSNTPGGIGATVPYTEYEAESAVYTGTLIGPSTNMGMNGGSLTTEMAAEASGREAVKLTTQGQNVQFTTTGPCNAIVVRYIIPDAPGGGGINATLSCYVNGVFNQELNMTSIYNWDYGNNLNYAFSSGVNVAGYDKSPSAGSAFHLYDETHALLGEEVPANSTITLQVGPSDTAAYYVIDFIDLEEVAAPLAMPGGFTSITDYGATSGGSDCSADIQNCVNANTQVWIPQGAFSCLSAAIKIPAGTTVEGAGMWYSSLNGYYATFDMPGAGTNLFSNFALFGGTTNRDDGAADVGFNDKAGTNSVLSDIWIEHEKVGYWVGNGTGTTQNLLITNCRIRDLYADGVNFSDGASNSTVTQCNFRNTGDDSLASWASNGNGDNAGNLFSFNTVQCPWRADCFALYGEEGTPLRTTSARTR